jgi:hypothetical protein
MKISKIKKCNGEKVIIFSFEENFKNDTVIHNLIRILEILELNISFRINHTVSEKGKIKVNGFVEIMNRNTKAKKMLDNMHLIKILKLIKNEN